MNMDEVVAMVSLAHRKSVKLQRSLKLCANRNHKISGQMELTKQRVS